MVSLKVICDTYYFIRSGHSADEVIQSSSEGNSEIFKFAQWLETGAQC